MVEGKDLMNKENNIDEVVKNMCAYSINQFDLLKEQMEKRFDDEIYESLCVYVCGSLGRFEMTKNSDLDLFFIKESSGKRAKELSDNINKYDFFGKMKTINSEMKYKKPSKGGAYWVFTEENDLQDIGSRDEDSNNGFTARLLLILESKPIFNEKYYNKLISDIIDSYLKDYDQHKETFFPLFLMNDILRFWYTLTLNYEYRRDDKDSDEEKNWKRLKLKYARLLTCFSMIACLYKDGITKEYIIDCIKKTPIERLNMISSLYPDTSEVVEKIIRAYNKFLDMRKSMNNDFGKSSVREKAFKDADEFHHLVVKEFLAKVSEHNTTLKDKVDVY